MKKIVKLFCVVLTACVIFAGCSKKDQTAQTRKPSENIDSSDWIDNMIDAKAAAQKENKKIFLLFSGDDQDSASARVKQNIFNTSEFKDEMTKNYVLVNLDFSLALQQQAVAEPTASEEEKAVAAAIWQKLEENMRDATLYNVQATPSFYLLSKEGYVIWQIIFENEPKTTADFFEEFNKLDEDIAVFENTLESARHGKTEDRLAAINKLFELTDPQVRHLLTPFSEEYIKLDKKDTTKMVGLHVIAIANAKAIQHYLDQDPLAASEEFAKVAENKYLVPEQKQQAYYTAGYLYAVSGESDHKRVKDYFQKAYDAAPDSKDAESILSMIRMMEENYGESAASAADAQEAASTENTEGTETTENTTAPKAE